MQRMVAIAVLLLCFVPAYAKDKNEIPEELWDAKNAVVRNSGSEMKDYEKLIRLLKEWGRFEILEEGKSAEQKIDIVITLSTRLETRTVRMPSVGGGLGGFTSQQVLLSAINIFNFEDGTLLWTDETTSSKDPKQLVDKLKGKMKKRK